MNTDASFKFGYTPNQKRPKLGHSVPHVEHRSVVVSTLYKNHYQVLPHCCDMQSSRFIQQKEYAMEGISQVCTRENYCKKRSPKCLPQRVSFCSSASGELRPPIDTRSLVEENNIASNGNTTVRVVCTYIAVCLSCDTNDACKVSGGCGYPISNYSYTAVLTVL